MAKKRHLMEKNFETEASAPAVLSTSDFTDKTKTCEDVPMS